MTNFKKDFVYFEKHHSLKNLHYILKLQLATPPSCHYKNYKMFLLKYSRKRNHKWVKLKSY